VKEKALPQQLLSLKKKTSWSWAKMGREFHRVMGHEGLTHTTLFRYAKGKHTKRPYAVTERYVQQAIQKVTAELSQNRQA
jgi:mannose-1-phosphate guanylyltransferase